MPITDLIDISDQYGLQRKAQARGFTPDSDEAFINKSFGLKIKLFFFSGGLSLDGSFAPKEFPLRVDNTTPVDSTTGAYLASFDEPNAIGEYDYFIGKMDTGFIDFAAVLQAVILRADSLGRFN